MIVWLRLLFVWRGSMLSQILPQLLAALGFAVLVTLVHGQVWCCKVPLNLVPFSLIGLALAIFLGFRNSVSYERFWEARKQWGALLIATRSLVREVVSFAPDETALQQRVARTLAAAPPRSWWRSACASAIRRRASTVASPCTQSTSVSAWRTAARLAMSNWPHSTRASHQRL